MGFPTATGKNAAGEPITLNLLPTSGQKPKADSLGVVLASDQDALTVGPHLQTGGNISVATPAAGGSAFTTLPTQAAKQLTVVNVTGSQIEVRQGGGGVALPLPDGTIYTFYGITNLNQLSLRRSDGLTSSLAVACRWEA